MSENFINHLKWCIQPPAIESFITMRAACGWGRTPQKTARAALDNGVLNLCAYDSDTLVGFGRVVGDGALYFYLQDIIVDPAWRGRGLGHRIVAGLLEQIKAQAAPGGMVGLMSAQGKEAFYAQHGFTIRPTGQLGAGMTLVL